MPLLEIVFFGKVTLIDIKNLNGVIHRINKVWASVKATSSLGKRKVPAKV